MLDGEGIVLVLETAVALSIGLHTIAPALLCIERLGPDSWILLYTLVRAVMVGFTCGLLLSDMFFGVSLIDPSTLSGVVVVTLFVRLYSVTFVPTYINEALARM